MHIILEGLDRSGKSTLADQLSKDYNFKVVHVSKPKTDDPYQEYLDLFNKYDGKDVIFDRMYLGEYVYSNLYRDGCTISDFQFHVLDHLAQRNSAIFIYAMAKPETILERCRATNEKLSDFNYLNDIETAQGLYDEILDLTYLNAFIYDSDKTDAATYSRSMKYEIDIGLSIDATRRRLDAFDCRSTGSPIASVAIIGERLRPAVSLVDRPFTSGTAAQYLFRCLQDSHLFKRSLYITNAYKPWFSEAESIKVLRSELKIVQPHAIICLGNEAARLIAEGDVAPGVDKICIPHPSFWKRFHHADREGYVSLLNKGIRANERV